VHRLDVSNIDQILPDFGTILPRGLVGLISMDLIVRRRCPKCGAELVTSRAMPDKPDVEQRTFECVRCGDETYSARLGRLGWARLARR
jgi:hypothetical protein